jgi:hypothetical protein
LDFAISLEVTGHSGAGLYSQHSLKRCRQEDLEFKVGLGCIVRLSQKNITTQTKNPSSLRNEDTDTVNKDVQF